MTCLKTYCSTNHTGKKTKNWKPCGRWVILHQNRILKNIKFNCKLRLQLFLIPIDCTLFLSWLNIWSINATKCWKNLHFVIISISWSPTWVYLLSEQLSQTQGYLVLQLITSRKGRKLSDLSSWNCRISIAWKWLTRAS